MTRREREISPLHLLVHQEYMDNLNTECVTNGIIGAR